MLPVCPKCDIKMIVLSMHDVEIDMCHRCRGVWLDAGELEEIVRQTGATADDALMRALEGEGQDTKARKYMCPRCDTSMRQLAVKCPDGGDLIIERCVHAHGLWFDEHELQKLLTGFSSICGTAATVEFLNDFFGVNPDRTGLSHQ